VKHVKKRYKIPLNKCNGTKYIPHKYHHSIRIRVVIFLPEESTTIKYTIKIALLNQLLAKKLINQKEYITINNFLLKQHKVNNSKLSF